MHPLRSKKESTRCGADVGSFIRLPVT